jgi:hypothetical protein
MQWPLTFQSHGSFLIEKNWFFIADQTPLQTNQILLSVNVEAGRNENLLRAAIHVDPVEAVVGVRQDKSAFKRTATEDNYDWP